jgi:predicted Zn-dependent peptidase
LPDGDAVDLLGFVLSNGRSSRFYESLVRQQQLAVNVGAFAPSSRGPRLLRIIATPIPGKPLDALEAAIDAEVERIKSGPIADWEVDKARNIARRQMVANLGSSLSRAIQLAENALTFNDPGRINTEYDRITRVTAADLQRVARQYLTRENRTVVITNPASPAPKGGR